MTVPILTSGNSLVADTRQWLIYDSEPVQAAMRAIEVLAMAMSCFALQQSPDIQMRAVGHVMERVAETRLLGMEGKIPQSPVNDYDPVAASHLRAIFAAYSRAGGITPLEPGALAAAEELHRCVYFLDQRLNEAGVAGPGWFRELARGD